MWRTRAALRMALTPGEQFAGYDVRAPLGRGGMGEVYRAHDRRLRRDVAIKVLPHAFSDDPDRLARFEREARVLASLNHPNIGAIYALEESGGTRALVLELVEGPTLADRLQQGALPVDEALVFARHIAEALEAAHARGIIHRDLKPANIKLTGDGSVKVLDFGIAKALDSPPADPMVSPTTMTAASQAGTILGTAAYMSPEQARGQAVDSRTDIWSFGCVLYEMVAGRRPFAGGTAADMIAAILEHEPDWSHLPERAPATLRRLLRRCLEKNPRQRLRDIGDARIELDDALVAREDPAPILTGASWRRHVPRALTGGLVAILLLALGWLILSGQPAQGPPLVTRTSVTLPSSQELDVRGRSAPLALSPDGRRLVYVAHSAGQTHLYLRELEAFDARPLPATGGAHYPFFSPDGQWVAFFADGKLKRVSIQGGSPVTICDAPVIGRGGTWGADGRIVFDPGEVGLMQVDVGSGRTEPLTTGDAAMDAHLRWPHFLPDGRTLLATAVIDGTPMLVARSPGTGRWHQLGRGLQPQYVASGHLVFHAPHVREGEIQIVTFDPERLETRGEPISVLDGVFRSQDAGGAYFAVAPNGALIFAPGVHARTLVRVDRNGRRAPLTDDRRGFRMPRISPDGRQIAVTVDPRPSQIWIYDIARRSGVPLATVGHNISPLWAPDARRVAFYASGDMFWRAADASAEAIRLLAREGPQYPGAWSNDGQFIVFATDDPTTGSDIWVMPLGGGEPRALVATRAHESNPALSSDQRWLAYTSDESGRPEIHVRPFPNIDEGKWVVSAGGGDSAVWSPTGREVFYMNGAALMAVGVDTTASEFVAGKPDLLFTGPFETGSPRFDISPDGAYFVMIEADPDARPTRIHVVLNWSEELRHLTSSR
jgi:eukaryotic-like serine/threonine-protein kinase